MLHEFILKKGKMVEIIKKKEPASELPLDNTPLSKLLYPISSEAIIKWWETLPYYNMDKGPSRCYLSSKHLGIYDPVDLHNTEIVDIYIKEFLVK